MLKRSLEEGRLPLMLQRAAIVWINPVAFTTSIWALRLGDSGAAALPFMGVAVLSFGLLMGQLAGKALRLSRESGTVFSLSVAMTNIGNIGALAAFFILGEKGFALIPFYKVFEEVWYYGVCFPFAARAGKNTGPARKLRDILRDPFLFMSLLAIGLGLALNFSGLPRPALFKPLNSILVPLSTLLLLLSVGLKIPERRHSIPRPTLTAFFLIKLLVIPMFSLLAAWVLGLAAMPDPTAFHLTILLSLMPTAFISLIPPTLYGLDFGLSFGIWIISNLTLAGTLPFLWILLT